MEYNHKAEEIENLQIDNPTKITEDESMHLSNENEGQNPNNNLNPDQDYEHQSEENASWKSHWDLLLALFILVVMLVLKFGFHFVPTKIGRITVYRTIKG